MKRKNLIIIGGVLITLLFVLLSIEFNESPYHQLLKKYVKKGLPGAIILVQKPNNVAINAYGYSNTELKRKLSPNNIFYSASFGKVYCATAIMLLEQEKRLNIQDKIKEYLPDSIWKNIQNGGELTIQQLLNHSSGLPNLDYNRTFDSIVVTDPFSLKRSTIISIILKDQTKNLSQDKYSSSNYELLALIIDGITKNHAVFYNENIIKPLNLKNTFYKNELSYPASINLVDCYTEDFDNKLINISSPNSFVTSVLTGSDGVLASIQDYHAFFQSLIKGKILNETELNKMQNWVVVDSTKSYGLGLIRLKTKYGYAIGHDGDAWGEGIDVWYFPTYDISIVAATNVGTGVPNSPMSKLYNNFINDLFDIVLKKPKY